MNLLPEVLGQLPGCWIYFNIFNLFFFLAFLLLPDFSSFAIAYRGKKKENTIFFLLTIKGKQRRKANQKQKKKKKRKKQKLEQKSKHYYF